jgi:hypothetical protein
VEADQKLPEADQKLPEADQNLPEWLLQQVGDFVRFRFQ